MKSQPGELHGRARLKWAQVRKIRASIEKGVVVAMEYSITPSQVSRIRRGEIWKEPGAVYQKPYEAHSRRRAHLTPVQDRRKNRPSKVPLPGVVNESSQHSFGIDRSHKSV